MANSFNISIYITESNERFGPITVVQPANAERGCTNIYIRHIGETHYVSTIVQISSQLPKLNKCNQTSFGDKVIDKNEKHRLQRRQYMKNRRADPEFRKRGNENSLQRKYKNIETTVATREKNNRAATKRKLTNPEHIREIKKQPKRKRRAENPEHFREIDKRSKYKNKAKIRGSAKQSKTK